MFLQNCFMVYLILVGKKVHNLLQCSAMRNLANSEVQLKTVLRFPSLKSQLVVISGSCCHECLKSIQPTSGSSFDQNWKKKFVVCLPPQAWTSILISWSRTFILPRLWRMFVAKTAVGFEFWVCFCISLFAHTNFSIITQFIRVFLLKIHPWMNLESSAIQTVPKNSKT